MLFATPIAGELVKHGYIAAACFAGTCLIVGSCLIAAARFSQSRNLFARI